MNNRNDFPLIPGAEPFRLKGSGSKILLIHGFTASPTELRPIADDLHSKGYDIHSVLLPGHGTSPEDLQSKTRKDWWEAVKKKFEEINGCDYVIGFSMGALLACRLAVEFQEKIKGLIIISTFIKIKPKILSRVSFLFPLIGLFKPYISKSPETEDFFNKHNLISYMSYPVNAAYESVKLSKYTQRKIIPQITIPTLIIQGVKDDRVDPEGYLFLDKKIPAKDKKVILLPDSQHIVTVGPDKELLFKSIREFITNKE